MARRIRTMKNSNDTFGKGTSGLPLCSAVPFYFVVSFLRRTHKSQIRDLGRYVDKVMYECFNKGRDFSLSYTVRSISFRTDFFF